jgi:hypothetical protein
MKDELSLTLQMCDQLTYDNVFVYFQPGTQVFICCTYNVYSLALTCMFYRQRKDQCQGDLAVKAMGQLSEAIDMAKSSVAPEIRQ